MKRFTYALIVGFGLIMTACGSSGSSSSTNCTMANGVAGTMVNGYCQQSTTGTNCTTTTGQPGYLVGNVCQASTGYGYPYGGGYGGYPYNGGGGYYGGGYSYGCHMYTYTAYGQLYCAY